MLQTKYASAVPKNLGVRVDFRRAEKAISSPGVLSPSSAASAQESSSLTDTLHTSTWHDESQYGIASKLDAYDFKTKAEKTEKKEKC